MILTGTDIKKAVKEGSIEVSPYDPRFVGPNSLDVHLHPEMRFYTEKVLDARQPPSVLSVTIPDCGYLLFPGHLYLGRTVERTYTPQHVPKLGGRSSTGRLGINIHQTAGFGDLGFNGTWTLELSVVQPVRIYPGIRIGQIWFMSVSGAVQQIYDGQYQGQIDATPSGGVE